jgi:LPXTG-site transpeptidase (sortase) family protein
MMTEENEKGSGMRDRLTTLWREASSAKRVLLVGAPVAVLVVVVAGAALAMSGGGSEASHQVLAPTQTAASPTPGITDTATPAPTETPASAGLQASNAPPPTVVSAPRVAAVNPNLSGPGAPQSTGITLNIPKIGVNAPVYSRTVGENGQMGNPSGAWDVVLYDFSGWPGLGGMPGQPGANAVFAGHVDYIHVGPAVFWSIRDLQPGDQVTVNTPNGPITYAIQWSQWTDPDADFSQFVQQTGQESITLVTCIGSFSAGHYSNRIIVRGVRI